MATKNNSKLDIHRVLNGQRLWSLGPKLLLVASIVIASPVTESVAIAKSKPLLPAQGSTSPANGDLNPYGLAVVPDGFPKGTLSRGQFLVSNFNDSGNIQGNGKTIVAIDPKTAQQLGVFFQSGSPVGFTNALGIVKAGFVFAGSVLASSTSSGLLVIDSTGKLVTTITTGTNGPWGLAIRDQGKSALLFISNVLDGTITRIAVSFSGGFNTVGSPVTIGSGYAFGPDTAGLVVGPAGLAYDKKKDVLYVAGEDDNAIFAIPDASKLGSASGKGTMIFSDAHLHGPLGLMIAPNGNLITANADPTAHNLPAEPSEIIEFTLGGTLVREWSIDPNQGAAFAILNVQTDNANQFAYVDDVTAALTILRLAK